LCNQWSRFICFSVFSFQFPVSSFHTHDSSPFSTTASLCLNEQFTNCFNLVYVKGKHISYQRSKNVTNPKVSLIQIEGVGSPQDAKFYLGKRIAYVYRAQKEIRGSKIRVIWGKIARTHGNNGLVRANFKKNLPPKTFGASVRIMLYPSNI